jgi:hypothetical protein
MSGLAPATTAMRILSTVPPEISTFAKVRPSGTCGSLFCFLRHRSYLVQLHNVHVLRSRISQFQHFGRMVPSFSPAFSLAKAIRATQTFWGLITVDPDVAITLAK